MHTCIPTRTYFRLVYVYSHVYVVVFRIHHGTVPYVYTWNGMLYGGLVAVLCLRRLQEDMIGACYATFLWRSCCSLLLRHHCFRDIHPRTPLAASVTVIFPACATSRRQVNAP